MDLECTKLLSEEEGKKLEEKQKVLCLVAGQRLIIIDFDKLTLSLKSTAYSADLHSCIPLDLPKLQTLVIQGSFGLPSFSFQNSLFFVSVDVVDDDISSSDDEISFDFESSNSSDDLRERKKRGPEVYKVSFDFESSNSGYSLHPSGLPPLNDTKCNPIVEVIGNKVYVLSKLFVDRRHSHIEHFEFLDLAQSEPKWDFLPNPEFYVPDDRRGDVTSWVSHYVLGSRIYVVVYLPSGNCLLHYFDTETKTWEVAKDFMEFSFSGLPDFTAVDGKFVSVPPLDDLVLLNYSSTLRHGEPLYEKLYAVQVDSWGKPKRYQDIFHLVFSDHLPPVFDILDARIFLVKGSLICAIFSASTLGLDPFGKFIAMSLFRLVPSKGESDDGRIPAETQFLDVCVEKQYISRTGDDYLFVDSAYLF